MAMIGFDHLGLAHPLYPVREVIRQTPRGSAIGAFDTVFGDVIPAIEEVVKSGKFPAIRIQLWYAKDHSLISINLLKKRAPIFEKLAKRYPSVKVYLSHSCEYIEKNAAEVQKRVDILKSLAPSCVPVNTIWSGSPTPSTLMETHDMAAKSNGNIISTDGFSIVQGNVPSYISRQEKALICFLWSDRFNLRTMGTVDSEPKNRKDVPDVKYIKGVVRMSQPIGAEPVALFKGTIVPITAPMLWKPFSEDKGTGDVRANKPLFIVKSKATLLSVVNNKGEAVASLKCFGPYGDGKQGLMRYYSGTASNLFGYQIAERAKKTSLSEYVWILDKTTNTYYGPINPAFRYGSFKD